MESMFRDFRYGVRALWSDKSFTLTVVLTLAVCIGVNTAIFAVVNGVLLRPLPFPDSQAVLLMSNHYPKAGVGDTHNSGVADYYDRIRDVSAFDEQALYRYSSRTVEIESVPQRITALAVTPTLFQLLRATPEEGRTFTAEEGEVGNDKKVILSDGLARQLFGDPKAAVGRELRLSAVPYPIVGVMSPRFQFMDPGVRMWIPAAFTAKDKDQRHSNNWYHVGRLKPGATLQQAQAQVNSLNAANMDRFPQWKEILTNAGFNTKVEVLQDMMVKDVKRVLYLLWGGALFVLLIGALNAANLVLARTALRRRELATRLALGAGPARLTRELIVENVTVALAGGAAGAALGAGLLSLIARKGLDEIPRATEIRLDAPVFLAVLAMSLVTGVVLGLIPALQVFQRRLSEILQEGNRSGAGSSRSRRVRQSLVVAQIGLAFVLLVGAGLLLVSFRALLGTDLGFNPSGVLTAATAAPGALYKEDADVRAMVDRSLEAIRHIPGVTAAGATTAIPLSGDNSDSVIIPEGYQLKPGESLISPRFVSASPGFFEAMNIALIRGRYFLDSDKADSLQVAIVDETLARRFWPDRDPIGRRMFQPQDINNVFKVDEHTHWLTVVGVVRSIRMEDAAGDSNTAGAYYFPYAQNVQRGYSYAVKTTGDPAALARSLRTEFTRAAPGLALFSVRTMEERRELSLASRRTAMTLASGFGGLALFLSAIGIYGVLAYLVTQRRREIGIRAALGCSGAGIVRLVLNEGLLLLAAGLFLGLAGAAAMRRAVQSEIYGVQPLDPIVIGTVILSLALVALAACAIPARRATRVDPVIVLREE